MVSPIIVTIASLKGGVGKTTTAIHLAAYLQRSASTLLVDSCYNRSALSWASRGYLPFQVVNEQQATNIALTYDYIIIDTCVQQLPEKLPLALQASNFLVLPTTPDALSLMSLLMMVEVLQEIGIDYCILLTMLPPHPSSVGNEARESIEKANLPLFSSDVRRYTAFQTAALQGVSVYDVNDSHAQAAWQCYWQVGQELELKLV